MGKQMEEELGKRGFGGGGRLKCHGGSRPESCEKLRGYGHMSLS